MQQRSRKAAHQRYREGTVRQVGTCTIGKLTTGLTQVVNHYILNGQVLYAAGPVMMS